MLGLVAMNKAELLSLANKGKTEINGYPCEVKVFPCCGDPWIEIHFEPLSPLHPPLILGQKWVEHITDEECAEIPEWLDRYKREAEEFCREAETVVKATMNGDGTYSFTEVPEKVKANYADYPSALKRWLKQKHYISYIKYDQEYWYAPGNFTLDIDGVRYVPHWSYWLNCPYYSAKGEKT
jgi:hypothetical protein